MALSRVPGPDELFVGGIFTLRRAGALEATNITHIVSVLRYDFKEMQGWDKFQHCNVDIDDDEGENLLGELPRTTRFIMDGLQSGGGVLVHCAMGKSRSVAVAIAYLMATRSLSLPTVQSALDLIRQSRPIAEPNPGFMEQLALYKEMNCPLEDIDDQPIYQRWLYQQEVKLSIATGRAPELDSVRFEDEVAEEERGGKEDETLRQKQQQQQQSKKELRCRKCRRTLATDQFIIPHTPKSSSLSSPSPTDPDPATALLLEPISSLSLSQQQNLQSQSQQPCTHHFIHPLSWMRPVLSHGLLDGRLECPNPRCKALVGRYAWQGLRCSCGLWIVPAFSLQGGRVDVVVKRAATVGVGVGGMSGGPLKVRPVPGGVGDRGRGRERERAVGTGGEGDGDTSTRMTKRDKDRDGEVGDDKASATEPESKTEEQEATTKSEPDLKPKSGIKAKSGPRSGSNADLDPDTEKGTTAAAAAAGKTSGKL